ncbi:MAG: magnesium and cobalt transport protein CorA [Thermoplasmata archaeon HGW-Thermoplasmata-1]|nr:MAG: magnesium and cobalt transport protein CorA [Thermoplasmata archaeon HGW-Thermoplasmata-1]
MNNIAKRSGKRGMPPGSVIYTGIPRTEKARIDIIDYHESKIDVKDDVAVEECFKFKDSPTVSWINVTGLHETEIIEKLGEAFGFHPLTIEDIVSTDQRPKMEDFGNYVYIVLKMIYIEAPGASITSEQVSILLGNNFVISFQEKAGDVFDPIRTRINASKGRIRKLGADYLAYSILDAVVDNYFNILESFGEKAEELENEVIKNSTPETLNRMHGLKRELISLRKSVWPLRELLSGLGRGETKLFKKSTELYVKDVYDHTIQIIDNIESLRDVVSGMLDIYMSSLSNKMNEVMKVLTVIATIFIPLTFIAGVYGMNFEHMPELAIKWAYPAVMAFMASIGIIMFFFFKRKKWV